MGDFWTALVTETGREYLALTELERLGLRPYLPQRKLRFTPPRTTVTVMRKYALFPGYLLIELDAIDHHTLREARGLRRFRPILSHDDADRTPWRAPAQTIATIRTAEAQGQFDETPLITGDRIAMRTGILRGVEAVVGHRQAAKMLEILIPLFGGARAVVNQSAVMRM